MSRIFPKTSHSVRPFQISMVFQIFVIAGCTLSLLPVFLTALLPGAQFLVIFFPGSSKHLKNGKETYQQGSHPFRKFLAALLCSQLSAFLLAHYLVSFPFKAVAFFYFLISTKHLQPVYPHRLHLPDSLASNKPRELYLSYF